ncbi:MAG: hypothetical protein WBY93_23040, partial [Candidatus Binatus sp.]
MRARIFILCLLAGGLMVFANQPARAQTGLDVPGPANQNQPYIPPRQGPPPSAPYAPDNGDTIQLLPQLTQPAPAQPQPVPPPVNVAPMTAQAVPSLPAV